MVKEENKLGYGLKGKLISAVAMLLVAVIMVVSSTYAWFTLSTAPEVTGITTAVGANGALEMLLLTWDGTDWVYKNGTVESGDDSNTYWGNLVDLTDKDGKYGADKIILYPSELNLNGANTLGDSPLKTPVYGADGRVSDTKPNTVYGKYNGTAFVQNDDYYGFRGVGVASGMTERQLAFRNARSQLSTLMASARNAASTSLTNNGSTLANIAMQKAMQTAPKFTPAQVTAIGTMISDLKVSLGYIEQAYFQAYLAFAASSFTGTEDVVYTTIAGYVESSNSIDVLTANITNALTTNGLSADLIPANITNGIAAYKAALASVNAAETAYNAISKTETEYDWDDFDDALTPLVSIDNVKINGYTVTEAKANKDKIASEALATGVLVTMPTGGGVFADIADQAKDYKVDIKINLEPMGLDMDLGAKMDTATTITPVYLQAIYDGLAGREPTSKDTTMPLTEFYGYVIDLAFRTNAAQSNLLLQQQGVDRIYGDNNNEATMGKGSTMTFASADNNFTNEQVKSLMRSIRIVFFETTSQNIYAYAKLDVDNATVDADGVTAYMYLYKIVDNAYLAADNTIVFGKEVTTEGTEGTEATTKMMYYTDADCTTLYTGDVTTTAPVHQADYELKLLDKDAKITSLAQNTPTHVSTLVYLDGKTIENKDVASSVAQSMTGSMNLQFASDATLVPMEYGELHQTGAQTKTEEVAQGTTEYNPDSVSGATWAFKGTAPDGWTIDAANGKVTIPADAAIDTEVVITATVDEKVVKEITLKIVAAPATGG